MQAPIQHLQKIDNPMESTQSIKSDGVALGTKVKKNG